MDIDALLFFFTFTFLTTTTTAVVRTSSLSKTTLVHGLKIACASSFERNVDERAALMTVVAVSRMTRDLTAATGVAAVTSMVAVTPEVATVDCSSALLLSMVSFFFCCIVV